MPDPTDPARIERPPSSETAAHFVAALQGDMALIRDAITASLTDDSPPADREDAEMTAAAASALGNAVQAFAHGLLAIAEAIAAHGAVEDVSGGGLAAQMMEAIREDVASRTPDPDAAP